MQTMQRVVATLTGALLVVAGLINLNAPVVSIVVGLVLLGVVNADELRRLLARPRRDPD